MIKFTDQYIIEQYEKKYGFDEINKTMLVDIEKNSSRLSSREQNVSQSKKPKLVKKKLDTIIEEDSLNLSEGDNTHNQIDMTIIHSPKKKSKKAKIVHVEEEEIMEVFGKNDQILFK